MSNPFRHSICNEVFEKWDFAAACKSIRAAGYSGIEIAPFTLSEDPGNLSAEKRREYRSIIASEGLQFVGLHWLLVTPRGLHVSTPNRTQREKSWEYVRKLIDLCADLGPGGVMVFGSPRQRSTTEGAGEAEATANFVDGLADVAPQAVERGVTVLLEALPRTQCDVVTSIDEAALVVHTVGNPGLRTMFDTHNGVDEMEPHAVLVERYFDVIRHIHVNEMDGGYPGTGMYDFKPVLDMLRRRKYAGWISMECFDFTAGAEKIANESLRYLEAETAKL